MDPRGHMIVDKVQVNDELQTIDGVSVHEMAVGDVVKTVAGCKPISDRFASVRASSCFPSLYAPLFAHPSPHS